MPGKNHTGCVRSKRSTKPKSHGGLVESPEDSLDVSPSANTPPSELDTNEARDCKKKKLKKNLVLLAYFRFMQSIIGV